MHHVIENVRIAGIAAAVPQLNQSIIDSSYGTLIERQKFIELTGIETRRLASPEQCTSDFCFVAAKKLLDELNWDKNDIQILLFVSQTPDYFMPATSIVLQHRLGLPQTCMAFDINLGCSGYVIGLQVIANLLSSMRGKKALLLVGDTSTRIPNALPPLFGDGATATALEWNDSALAFHVESGSDGAGYKHIIQEHGLYRNPVSMDIVDSGITINGHAIFNFSTQVVPKAILSLLANSKVPIDTVDYFVFHQANKLLNECIRKTLKIDIAKHPYSLHKYGNTSSATIPLTIVSELSDKLAQDTEYTFVVSGFGIGLSWGTAVLKLRNVYMPQVIEI